MEIRIAALLNDSSVLIHPTSLPVDARLLRETPNAARPLLSAVNPTPIKTIPPRLLAEGVSA